MTTTSTIGRLAPAAAGSAVARGLAEFVVRSMTHRAASTCPAPIGSVQAPVLRSFFDFARANARGVMTCNVPYRTNPYRFRGPDVQLEKPPGVIRIAIGGDSVTMGSGVAEEATYAGRLEDLLNDEGSGTYQVLNLGVAGIAIDRVVQRIESIGLRFDPDLIVYGWTINDIEGPNYVASTSLEEKQAYIQEAWRFAHSRSRLLAKLWPRLVTLWSPDLSYASEVKRNYLENHRAWADFATGLDRLSEIQTERDLCVAVFLHTTLSSLGRGHPLTPVYQKVEAAARERGLFAIGSFDRHAGRDPLALSLAPGNPHPNPLGHELLAEALYAGVRELPQRCWRREARRRDSSQATRSFLSTVAPAFRVPP